MIVNTHDYEAMRVRHRIANPDAEPLPTIEEIVEQIMITTEREIKLEEVVHQVSQITGVSASELTKTVFTTLRKLSKCSKVAKGSKHGYWVSLQNLS